MSIGSALVDGLVALMERAPSSKGKQILQSLVHESETERPERRLVVAAELNRVEAADLAAARAHEAEIETLKARVDALQVKLNAGRNDLVACVASRRAACVAADQLTDRLRLELRQSASLAIPAFVATMRTLLRETYEARYVLSRVGIDGRTYCVFENTQSIGARAAAIQSAIDACGETGPVLYLPLDERELGRVLAKLRADLPELDQPTEAELRQAGAIA
jgi:hypothetical protein